MKKVIALILIVLTILPVFSVSETYDDRLTVVAMLGDVSDFIYVVETALYEKGYLNEYYVDGYFDEYTELAVMNFQFDKGYVTDGMLTKIQFYWLSRKYYNEWFDTSYIVWFTASGSRYHFYECKALQNSINVMPISINIAYQLGYVPCKLCKPY